MFFDFHIAFAIELIALVMGTFLLVRVCKEEICCKGFAKIVGIFTIVVSLLLFICTAYHTIKMHKGGFGKMAQVPSMEMHRGLKIMKDMYPAKMEKLMKECPMMKTMMDSDGKE